MTEQVIKNRTTYVWDAILPEAGFLGDIAQFVQSHAEPDPAHDWLHIQRVISNAIEVAQLEKANIKLVVIAALLHDIKNLPKSHPESHLSSQYSAEFANQYLQSFPLKRDEIEVICDAILNHSFSRGQRPVTLEGRVVQDADRLDSLGAIGIARCFVVGGAHQRKLYHYHDPFCHMDRELDDKQCTVDHFYRKLLKLPELMQTKSGRAMALERVERMKSFLSWMQTEVTDFVST